MVCNVMCFCCQMPHILSVLLLFCESSSALDEKRSCSSFWGIIWLWLVRTEQVESSLSTVTSLVELFSSRLLCTGAGIIRSIVIKAICSGFWSTILDDQMKVEKRKCLSEAAFLLFLIRILLLHMIKKGDVLWTGGRDQLDHRCGKIWGDSTTEVKFKSQDRGRKERWDEIKTQLKKP